MASPSHQKALLKVINKSIDDIPIHYSYEYLLKYSKCIVVYYDHQEAYSVNRFQKRTLDILAKENLIIRNLSLVSDDVKKFMKLHENMNDSVILMTMKGDFTNDQD